MVTTLIILNGLAIVALIAQTIALRKAATEVQGLSARLMRAARSLSA